MTEENLFCLYLFIQATSNVNTSIDIFVQGFVPVNTMYSKSSDIKSLGCTIKMDFDLLGVL